MMLNSSSPGDAIWRHITWSTLAMVVVNFAFIQVIVYCQIGDKWFYPRQCWAGSLMCICVTKTSKFRVTGLCKGNSPVTSEFPAQMASNTENVFIWWRHHDKECFMKCIPFYSVVPFTCNAEWKGFLFYSVLFCSMVNYFIRSIIIDKRYSSKDILWQPYLILSFRRCDYVNICILESFFQIPVQCANLCKIFLAL